MEDFRIKTSWFRCRKRRRLQRRLGSDGEVALFELWAYAAQARTDGNLKGLTDEDIADEAHWAGEPLEFVAALVEIELVDGEPGSRRIHNWKRHQPWVAGASGRSRNASKAAQIRWSKDKKNRGVNARRIDPHYSDTDTDSDSETNSDTDTETDSDPDATVGVGDLVKRSWGSGWEGWHEPSPSQRVQLEGLVPLTEREIDWAKGEVDRAPGKPNFGLFAHKIAADRGRKSKPAAPSRPRMTDRQRADAEALAIREILYEDDDRTIDEATRIYNERKANA